MSAVFSISSLAEFKPDDIKVVDLQLLATNNHVFFTILPFCALSVQGWVGSWPGGEDSGLGGMNTTPEDREWLSSQLCLLIPASAEAGEAVVTTQGLGCCHPLGMSGSGAPCGPVLVLVGTGRVTEEVRGLTLQLVFYLSRRWGESLDPAFLLSRFKGGKCVSMCVYVCIHLFCLTEFCNFKLLLMRKEA